MKTAVILSTYNSHQALYKSLLGYAVQSVRDFELIVADDGSDEQTRCVITSPEFASLGIRHVWHADQGFRKCRVLNKAVLAADADYLIFSDGDCIPRNDFVESHLRHARPQTFISGNRINVPAVIHERFKDDEISSNQIFQADFLISKNPRLAKFRWRLTRRRFLQRVGDIVTWRYCVFVGCNASAWRNDIEQINGFDEDFGYGSDDRELGVRLRNSGVRSRFLKYSLVAMHQDHPYTHDPEVKRHNRRVFRERWRNGTIRIERGLDFVRQQAAGVEPGDLKEHVANEYAGQ